MAGNDFFQMMTKEAQEELASGEKSWREVELNVLILACFGIMFNHLRHRITRPLWLFAASIAAGVIGYIVMAVLD